MQYRHVSALCLILFFALAPVLAVIHMAEKDRLGPVGNLMFLTAYVVIMPVGIVLVGLHCRLAYEHETPRQAWKSVGKTLLQYNRLIQLARLLAIAAIVFLLKQLLAKALGLF